MGSQVEFTGEIPRLLQIDGLVAAVLVELGAPYFVRALVLGWTEADEPPRDPCRNHARFLALRPASRCRAADRRVSIPPVERSRSAISDPSGGMREGRVLSRKRPS